jgi:hypothetical protein
MVSLRRIYFVSSPVPILLAVVGEIMARGWHGPGPSGGLVFVIYAFYTSLALFVIGMALVGAGKFKHQRVWPLVISMFVAASPFIYLLAGILCGAA